MHMKQTVRNLILVVVGAAALTACGVLNAFVPDQEVAGGVLGLGDGVDVVLAPAQAAVTTLAGTPVTTWVGSIDETVGLDALDADLPDAIEPAALTETIQLGDTVVVTHPETPTGSFTVTGVAIGGTFALGGATFNVPAGLSVDGLNVVFDDPTCVGDAVQTCTYTTASGLPELNLAFAASQVQAYWDLLTGIGGDVSVDLTVTVTLAPDGLPSDATVTVTLDTLGATIAF